MIREYCINKSLEISHQLFPKNYNKRNKYRTFHYCFGFIGKKLVSIGQNRPDKLSAKAFYFGERFNVEQFKKFSYLHAEIDMISRLWGKHHIDDSLSVYVVRLNSFGEQQNSKPCKHCQVILDALNITNIYWSPFYVSV